MKLRIEQLNLYLLITGLLLNSLTLINEFNNKVDPKPVDICESCLICDDCLGESSPELPIGFKFLLYLGPFLLGLILFIPIMKKNPTNANYFLFVVMGLFTTLAGSQGNTTGVLFLLFAMSLKHDNKNILKIIVMTVIVFGIKWILFSLTPGQILNLIVMYSFFGMIYYILMIKINKSRIEKDYSSLNIPNEVVDIITLRIQGFSYSKINTILELNITDERVSRKISDCVKANNFKSREHLIYFMTENGIIKSIIDKSHTYG